MPNETDPKADCYSAQERAAMVRYQDFKGWLLRPLLYWFVRLGVTADHITLLSLATGLAFCPFYFVSPATAFVMLALHLLIDGLDGPLARYNGTASRRGSFTDTAADQLVIAVTTVTWMYAPAVGLPGVGVVAGAVYVFLYTVVVVFAMVRNAMGIPYSLILRPRNVVYAWFFLEFYFFTGTSLEHSTEWIVWLSNAILAVKAATGFWNIRNAL